MNERDKALAASNEMAETIFDGAFLLQMVAWRAFIARHEADLPAGLGRLEQALRGFVDLRDRGLAEGGPSVTSKDVERVGRLAALVSKWLADGDLSPEIEPLSRALFAALGADVAMLPPEDAA
jgi:hypothetical protein